MLCFADSRKQGRGLVVAPDARGRAAGELYWDDGDSLGKTLLRICKVQPSRKIISGTLYFIDFLMYFEN